MEIRESKENDWETIQTLNNEVFIHDEEFDEDLDLNWPFSEVGISYYKDSVEDKDGKCFIAEIENKPVGYLIIGSKDFGYRKGKYLELENMGVLPKYRSMGIGHSLVEYAKQYAKSVNATKIYVSAYWDNESAIKFYKREGFEPIDMGLELEI
jgi:ribosomal protein S18 acetylase RimI-like enzyme